MRYVESLVYPLLRYYWRKRYSCIEASQLKELKELQGENAKLKRMYVELVLQNTMLKDVLGKKWQGHLPNAMHLNICKVNMNRTPV